MSDKGPLWNGLVQKYGLLSYSFREAASWPFGEAIFNLGYDVMADTTKARLFGFYEWVDTEEMLLRLFAQFQKMRFIPSCRGSNCQFERSNHRCACIGEIENEGRFG